jgi:flagellar protein FlgJ
MINPVGSMGVSTNNTYASSTEALRNAEFKSFLQEAEKKAAKSHEHIVNSENFDEEDKKLKEACKGFETMFLQMMYRSMRATVPESPLFGKSNAMSIFEEMRDNELMKQTAESGGLGLADIIYKQLAPSVHEKSELMNNK